MEKHSIYIFFFVFLNKKILPERVKIYSKIDVSGLSSFTSSFSECVISVSHSVSVTEEMYVFAPF